MKKLTVNEMEGFTGGSPDGCVNHLTGVAGALIHDPVFFIIFYDGILLRPCLG
jgi:hypothetical protein